MHVFHYIRTNLPFAVLQIIYIYISKCSKNTSLIALIQHSSYFFLFLHILRLARFYFKVLVGKVVRGVRAHVPNEWDLINAGIYHD